MNDDFRDDDVTRLLHAGRDVQAPPGLFERIAAADTARRTPTRFGFLRAAAAFFVGATLFATAAVATRGVGTAEPGSASRLLDEIGRAIRVVEADAGHYGAGPELELVESILEERK